MKVESRWSGVAPAKVNLRLKVLARESSGFHQIETEFQSLDLSDQVVLELRPGGQVDLELSGVAEGDLGPASDNLAVRAARAFQEGLRNAGGDVHGVWIHLDKRIPHGAGLGGGSSDAACVLRGLNALAEHPFSQSDLIKMGGKLGSDVAFFLSGSSRALAWGRGDRLLPLPALPPRDVLVVVPKASIATDWAYRKLSEAPGSRSYLDRAGPVCHSPPGEVGWDEVASGAVNDFEAALFPIRPGLARIKRLLCRMGGEPALLSGSGSSVFAVFHSQDGRDAAAAAIAKAEPELQLIRTRTAR